MIVKHNLYDEQAKVTKEISEEKLKDKSEENKKVKR